jgi:histone deacetylase 1/2
MKPHRMRMTHNLVLNYGLLEHMDVYVSLPLSVSLGSLVEAHLEICLFALSPASGPHLTSIFNTPPYHPLSASVRSPYRRQRPTRANKTQLTRFHSDEYIDFLETVTPETVEEMTGGGVRCESGPGVPEVASLSMGLRDRLWWETGLWE